MKKIRVEKNTSGYLRHGIAKKTAVLVRKYFTTVIQSNLFMNTSMFLRRHFNIIITSGVQLENYFDILYDSMHFINGAISVYYYN